MSETAAPAAESTAAPAPQSSVHERLKAFLGPQSAPSPTGGTSTPVEQSADPKASSGGVAPPKTSSDASEVPNEAETDVEAEGDQQNAEVDDDSSDDAQFDPAQLKTLSELADATGLESDRLMDLELPVKIDGKEGTARLRDLVKSYQLDGHINQKLSSLDTDRKTFEAKKVEAERGIAERLLRLDAGVKTLERAMQGEFAGIDWAKLQAENPLEFNSQYVAYQQRYAQLNDIANQIAQEQQQFQSQAQAQASTRLAEEFKLLQAKVPEWADTTRRNKDKADIVDYLKSHGISREEFEAIADHRQLLVVRDAWKWHQLQKSKPTTLNKVKAAPKLLKPGTPQSRAVVEGLAAKRERETLRQSGRARDAKPILKRLLFGSAR